jgi:hypothetical protein
MRRRFAVVLVCSTLMGSVLMGLAQIGQGGQTLAGAWNVSIHFDGGIPPCAAPAVFNADGGIVANACSLSESPGYGTWVRVRDHEFASTFIGLEYGPDGSTVGTYKVRAKATLSGDGLTFTAPFKTEVFGLDGTVMFAATGTVTARRILVEPL